MPRRKHLTKKKPVVRTDANQGVIERTERIRKQNAYIIRKLAEMRAAQLESQSQTHYIPEMTDGLEDTSRDIANE